MQQILELLALGEPVGIDELQSLTIATAVEDAADRGPQRRIGSDPCISRSRLRVTLTHSNRHPTPTLFLYRETANEATIESDTSGRSPRST